MQDVKERGDEAVLEWSLRLDGVEPARPVPDTAALPRDEIRALADSVRRWHLVQKPLDVTFEPEPGVQLQRRWCPIESVGAYVPRGLISTLIMCVVPAQVAGVERIVVTTPPEGAERIAGVAELLGIADVWAIGGPQAIAALAYGTQTIPPVTKIVGPGNAFVNEAKLIASKDVAIDLPAGPSEVVVLVTGQGYGDITMRELAAQAEHGPHSLCRIIDGEADLEAALDEVESIAPEHLVLLGEEAEALAPRVRHAGAVFVGPYSPVAAGDYATGGNHVLPTGGWARSTGGIGIETFLKPVTVQRITRSGLERLRPTVEALAEFEGMHAHAKAVRR
jgi:histidinol dehydrogenase